MSDRINKNDFGLAFWWNWQALSWLMDETKDTCLKAFSNKARVSVEIKK